MLLVPLIEKIIARMPLGILPNLLPDKFVLCGHLVSNIDHPIRNRYRYPNFREAEECLSFLKSNKYEMVSLEEYFIEDGKKKVMLTFDDGFIEIYQDVHPFLKKNNFPYTIFIMTGPLENPAFSLSFTSTFGLARIRP